MKEEAYSLVIEKSAYYTDNISNCQYDNTTLLSKLVDWGNQSAGKSNTSVQKLVTAAMPCHSVHICVAQ